MNCGVVHRRGSDPALLWPWCRPVAIVLIRPLAWELPYAMGMALKSRKKKKKKSQYCGLVYYGKTERKEKENMTVKWLVIIQ